MKKSQITREPFTGRRVCQFEPVMAEKCHDRATETMTVTSFPLGPDNPMSRSSRLCREHGDQVQGCYEREWAKYPENFTE